MQLSSLWVLMEFTCLCWSITSQIFSTHTHLLISLDTSVIIIPPKENGLRCCDEIDPIAKAIGAISCMIKRPNDGKLFFYRQMMEI
ncbi:hypothetical protein GLYMA_10G158350v4 [Glycine max]|nr:hypothetical protein GLYMA_10G158350v4 [Glycine max]